VIVGDKGDSEVCLGSEEGSCGVYELSGGDLRVQAPHDPEGDAHFYVGKYGEGRFVQSGGTAVMSATRDATLYLGYQGRGTFSQSGGSFEGGRMEIGASLGGDGLYALSGDATAVVTETIVGAYSSAAGKIDISGSANLSCFKEVVGEKSQVAEVTQSGGTHSVITMLTLGYESGSQGKYVLSGGLLEASGVAVGLNGAASFSQWGGTHSVSGEMHLGHNVEGYGTYTFGGGTLAVGTSEYVGFRGTGRLEQRGGSHTVGEGLHLGYGSGSSGIVFLKGAGSLITHDLSVGGNDGEGELNIETTAFYLEIQNELTLGPYGALDAVQGATVHMTGSAFRNWSSDEAALAGLANLEMVFEGGTADWATFEVAGRDLGPGPEGFVHNFTLGGLSVGGGQPATVRLEDQVDNGNRSSPEAQYVSNLYVGTGSTLDMNGLHLYCDGVLIEDGTIIGGSPNANWVAAVDEHWEEGANWSTGLRPVSSQTAVFDEPRAFQPTLQSDGRVSGVDFATSGWTLGGDSSALSVGAGGITSAGTGVNTVGAGVVLSGNSTWTVEAGNTLAVSGPLSGGGQTLTKEGGGTLAISGAEDLAAFNIASGNVRLTSGGAAILVTEALVIGSGAALDLAEGALVVNYTDGASPFDDLVALVEEGFNNIDTDGDGYPNLWEGTGITSAEARDNSQLTTGLAIIANDDPLSETSPPKVGGLSHLEGVPVDPTSILIKYGWTGDANLDGVINSNDYDLIDTAWMLWSNEGRVPEGGFRYAVGDFNYDGIINSNDYDMIDRAWVLSEGAPCDGGAPAPTPEPATLALLAAGLAGLIVRKRRT